MKISADFTRVVGKIKPMHGIGQPPLFLWMADDLYMHYLGEAGIPFSRLHDTGGRYGGGVYVDIPNIFRNFDADETLPESYDFRSTDRLISHLEKQGCEPFYRLGVTIENDHLLCAYRIFPPKDYGKWARICEHIVRHYNEGWADGYHFGIRYWEIWNEPDDCLLTNREAMWRGSREDYYRLYEVTANHLKACFGDSIKVGGYASSGFYQYEHDPDGTGLPYPVFRKNAEGREELIPGIEDFDQFIAFFHDFLKWIKSPEHPAPLDFFSWHSYADVPTTLRHQAYCRKVLEHEGFGEVEDILDEWNTCIDERRGTEYGSANVLAMMLAMQKRETAVLNFYDGSMGLMVYSGLFNAETHKPHPTYFTFMAFNRLYRLGNEIETCSDDPEVYVGGAAEGGKKVLLIANRQDHEVEAELDITGADCGDVEILRIDGIYTYAPTGKRIENGKLILPKWSCTEIRF